ncbi:MAG: DUF4349 domain-containing protein [Anaerolineae bacterium]|nr:DUF4349 domain-containing protein [Anaerolineae bacterium]
MSHPLFTQNKMHYIVKLLLLAILVSATACSGAQPTAAPASQLMAQDMAVEPEAEKMGEAPPEEPAIEAPAQPPLAATQVAAEADTSTQNTGLSPVSNRPNVYDRLIIKDANLELLVKSTDTAINRSLGIVAEYGGYVVSNRTWFQDEYKYATLTIGVPSENFEEMLRRLKDLAISVTNESVSGQDVTDEYVDLRSRLTNLEATADRIRTFLEQTQTVKESLEVSAQLSEIEAQIEQVKGRMAYLKERAAFSTITLQISPKLPDPPAPTPTPSPTPTPTPEPWSAGRTFNNATTVTNNAARSLFQTTVDLIIWVVIVILPFTLPIAVITWTVFWLARRLGGGQPLPPSS